MRIFLLFIFAIVLSGCASKSMLPKSSSEINFSMNEGKTGWSQYKQVETFRGYQKDRIYAAAKAGLGAAGFALREADISAGRVVGEHGITLHDWNIIAGVYFRESGMNTDVAIVIEGSKDTGFSGDVTGDGWSGKIIKEMYNYLAQTK
ncbi:hypothetical protein N9831_00035 [Amylibacter sp.]|jgi:hypothetical protein|nr:hypothetical protein [Amylibacter sp.]